MLQLVRVMSVLKEYKILVKKEIRKFFKSSHILKQNFYNVSDFKSKILQCVRLCFKKILKNQNSKKNVHSKNDVLTEVTP